MLEGIYLLADFCRYFRVAVAAVDDGYPGKAVQVFFSLMVVEVLHFTSDELRGPFVKVTQAGHYVGLFFGDNGVGAQVGRH